MPLIVFLILSYLSALAYGWWMVGAHSKLDAMQQEQEAAFQRMQDRAQARRDSRDE